MATKDKLSSNLTKTVNTDSVPLSASTHLDKDISSTKKAMTEEKDYQEEIDSHKEVAVEVLENTELNEIQNNYDKAYVSDDENMYSGEVVTLNKALGATSDSDTEEEDDETITINSGNAITIILTYLS